MKVLEDTRAVLSLGKLCDEHGYSCEWINGQKPRLIQNGIRIQCSTENFFPIVVLGLSTSSSSSLPSSTSMTPSRKEIDHPTSSSSSSTSPTTAVSSDSETRAREDLSGMESHPALVSSSHVERTERSDPLTKPTKNPKPNKNEDHDQERGDPLNSEIPDLAARVQRKSWWMTKFQNMETLTPVLLVNHLQSVCQREVRIWVKTML